MEMVLKTNLGLKHFALVPQGVTPPSLEWRREFHERIAEAGVSDAIYELADKLIKREDLPQQPRLKKAA